MLTAKVMGGGIRVGAWALAAPTNRAPVLNKPDKETVIVKNREKIFIQCSSIWKRIDERHLVLSPHPICLLGY